MADKWPQAPMREADRFSPVFVLATARSYSSVITTMVGQHPEMMGLPELKLFCYPTIGELEASLPRFWSERGVCHRSPGLVRALAYFEFGSQDPKALVSSRTWLANRRNWSGADVLDVLLNRIHPRVAVEKSPENVATDAALNRLASAYPRARYLHLTRHPVTTQQSMQEHLRRIAPGHSFPGEPMSLIASWVEDQSRIMRFGATLPGTRYLRVKAEDVLNDTRAHLRSIASWLQFSADHQSIEAMAHPEVSPFAAFGPAGSGVAGGNDPAFLRDPVPHPVEAIQTLDPPAGWEGNASLWRTAVTVATQLGYP
jgi:hypothetical protein